MYVFRGDGAFYWRFLLHPHIGFGGNKEDQDITFGAKEGRVPSVDKQTRLGYRISPGLAFSFCPCSAKCWLDITLTI